MVWVRSTPCCDCSDRGGRSTRILVWITITIFAAALVGGATLGMMRLARKPLPPVVIHGHGGMAAIGVALLIVVAFTHPMTPALGISLVFMVVAAMVGLIMAAVASKTGRLRVGVMLTHAVMAICGFVALLAYKVG